MPDAEPMIIDDGGSTRIKHHRLPHNGAFGQMDGLLNVTVGSGGIPSSNHPFSGNLGKFKKFKIVFIDPATGEPHEMPLAGLGLLPALATGDKVEIFSGTFKVQVDIDAGGASKVTVFGVVGVDPVVEAKQHAQRRRYVVSNSPPIDQVIFTRAGAAPGPPVFDASLAANASVYTMLHFAIA